MSDYNYKDFYKELIGELLYACVFVVSLTAMSMIFWSVPARLLSVDFYESAFLPGGSGFIFVFMWLWGCSAAFFNEAKKDREIALVVFGLTGLKLIIMLPIVLVALPYAVSVFSRQKS